MCRNDHLVARADIECDEYGMDRRCPGARGNAIAGAVPESEVALEVTQDNRSRAAQLARELTTHAWRLHEHYGFFKVFRATHPSDADRVRLALTYQPWKNGGPGEFDELCERLD